MKAKEFFPHYIKQNIKLIQYRIFFGSDDLSN